MFRIDRTLVNLAGGGAANADGSIAGAEGSENPDAPASAEIKERANEILEDAQREAWEIIETAKSEAEMILQSAEIDVQEEFSRARQSGYAEGTQLAESELEEKLRHDEELLQNVLREIHSQREQMLLDSQEDLVALALEIAERIIRLAMNQDDSIFPALISTALSQMELEGRIVIRVGPEEFNRFFKSGNAVFDLGDGVTAAATVIKDLALDTGDCVIDTDNETINAGVQSQLKTIRIAFDKAGDY